MLSQAQNRAMHSAAEGHSTLGIPKSVGDDFVNASHGEKVSGLPQRKKADPPSPPQSLRNQGSASATGKFGKAMQHHAAIGSALEQGDGQGAMRHIGHTLLAVRSAMGPTTGDPQQAQLGSTPAESSDPTPAPSVAATPPTSPTSQTSSTQPTGGSVRKGHGMGNFIGKAIEHPGYLHTVTGTPQGEKIPAKKVTAAEHSSNPHEAAAGRLAVTLKGLRK